MAVAVLEKDGTGFNVVHILPGRARLRLEALPEQSAEPRVLAFLEKNGVRARLNRLCASIILQFDPAILSFEQVCRLLSAGLHAAKDAARATTREPRPSLLASLVRAVKRLAPPWMQCLAGAAALLAGITPVAAPITTGLLMAAISPIIGRAIRVAIGERHFGVDALDSLAAVLMLARGNFVATGVMAALIGLGEFIRERTARRSQAMLDELQRLLGGQSAWLVRGRKRVRVPVDSVRPGNTVVIYTGDTIPVDGRVTSGEALVDQKNLTGESMPARLQRGAHAYASTILTEGKVYVRCTAAGKDTRASNLIEMVRAAPFQETRTQNYAAALADRAIVPILLTAGLSLLITRDLARAISILIIDFSTGIRVSAPTSVLTSMQVAGRRGVLIKGGGALERLASVDAIVFDKTGTLTCGDPRVRTIVPLNGLAPADLLRFTAAAEQRLTHPAARAIMRYADEQGVTVPEREASEQFAGMGVKARVEGREIVVGSAQLLERQGIALDTQHLQNVQQGEGATSLSYIIVNQQPAGVLIYTDPPRPEARRIIAALRRRRISEIVMVTGDRPAAANVIARATGIRSVVADAFPDDKVRIVHELKARGHTVAVVGDGINDSPALAHADVAISLHGSTDIARERADIVLTDDSLSQLPEAIDIARNAMQLVRQNLLINVVSNTAGLVLAAAGRIGPQMATLANNGSAVLSSVNSMRPLFAASSVPLQGDVD